MKIIILRLGYGNFFLCSKRIFFRFYLTKAEMLALTKTDVDFENNQISITNTYYRTERRDIITTPKTEQAVRVIDIPQF